jgi:hypothetical protein
MVAILDVIKRDQFHFVYLYSAHEKYRMNVIYGIQPEIWKSYGYIPIREIPHGHGRPPKRHYLRLRLPVHTP